MAIPKNRAAEVPVPQSVLIVSTREHAADAWAMKWSDLVALARQPNPQGYQAVTVDAPKGQPSLIRLEPGTCALRGDGEKVYLFQQNW